MRFCSSRRARSGLAAAALIAASSGAHGLATAAGGASASTFDTASGAVGSLATGPHPEGVAVVPDQAPTAKFWVSPVWRFAKRKLTFHAGASSDPDGSIATYAWVWGDGHHVTSTSGVEKHRYARPGLYQATLTVTDDEGCSTERVFTGQTVSCNGSSLASVTVPIEVLDRHVPGLHLAGGRRQRLRKAVAVFAKCPLADCGLRARGTVVASFPRRASRPGSERPRYESRRFEVHLGPDVASAPARAWTRLPLELPGGRRRALARALRAEGRVVVRLTVVARDVHGITQLRHRDVRLLLSRHVRARRHHTRIARPAPGP